MEERAVTHAQGCVPEFASDAPVIARRISGGISNHLIHVALPDQVGPEVLVRLYGTDEPLAHRGSEELLVEALSSHGIGPTIFAVFEGGRVEQFWARRRSLLPSEPLKCVPVDFAALVASRVAELHELWLAVPGRPTAEEQLARWLSAVEGGGPVPLEALRAAIDGVPRLRPAASTASEKAVEDVMLQRTMCHLDLFAANILYDDALGDVQLIDYEYSADAPIGLDIANHLSGTTELIEGERVTFDPSLYPTLEQQAHWLRSYLGARHLPEWAVEAMPFATELLLAFAAEAELRWVVWGLLQLQLSSIAFDYGDYAVQRWRCYSTYAGRLSGQCPRVN